LDWDTVPTQVEDGRGTSAVASDGRSQY